MKNANVVLVDGFYGNDETHARSAWTSTDKRSLSAERRARIPGLLLQLGQDGHHTPFEKSALHFTVTTDIATHIHLIKHRVAVSLNAESARYQELKEDKYYIPQDWPMEMKEQLSSTVQVMQGLYHAAVLQLSTKGYSRARAKESGRYFLPYASQITADVMFNFRSFMHFCDLRYSAHAQREVREVAVAMLGEVKESNHYNASLRAFGYVWEPESLPLRCMNHRECGMVASVTLDTAGWWEPPPGWLRHRWGPTGGIKMVCSRACADRQSVHATGEAYPPDEELEGVF